MTAEQTIEAWIANQLGAQVVSVRFDQGTNEFGGRKANRTSTVGTMKIR